MSRDNLLSSDINQYIHLLAGDPSVRMRATQALAQIGDLAIPSLLQALRDQDRWLAAAEILAVIGPPAIHPLIHVMREPLFANFAFHALSKMGKVAVPALIAALSDTDAEVRMWAATAFELDPDSRSYDALAAVLKDPDPIVRATVVRAIAELSRPEILPQLQEMQHTERNYAVQQALDGAVSRLSAIR